MLAYRKTGSSFNGASLERVLSVNVFGHLEGVFLQRRLLTCGTKGMQRHAMSLCSRLFLEVDLEVGPLDPVDSELEG